MKDVTIVSLVTVVAFLLTVVVLLVKVVVLLVILVISLAINVIVAVKLLTVLSARLVAILVKRHKVV